MNPSASIPPPPPIAPLVTGSIPARRLQTQLPAEAPACVQNAMMTKDKKPFTYTPGGIDLSQIKSPRMAKRIYMNAHSEGVTNQPKISPLAQPNNSVGGVPAPSMGAAAMGMPFQVFPGPPPPVMPVSVPMPPPPPPQPKMQQLNNQSNGNREERKSPQNQSFDPPPIGCRPEIKIPPNPMASLKRAPRPQPKGDYWIDEYRQEKMGGENEPTGAQYMSAEDDERTPSPEENVYEQQKSFNEPKPQTPVMSPLPKNNVVQDLRMDSPKIQSPPIMTQSPIPANLPPPITPIKTPVTSPIKEDVQQPFHTQILYQQPQQPQNMQQQQQQQPKSNIIISTMPQMKNSQLPAQKELGALYIPPPMEDPLMKQQYYMTPQSPPWMSAKPKGDIPEWGHKDEIDFNQMQLQHQRFSQQQQQQFNQMMTPKERIIPISFEKSTTPVRTPAGFGPQPYYGSNQQFISPKPDPNANQFVNQGYNNISFSAPQSPMVMQQHPLQQQQSGTRIIPVQIERSNGSQNRSPYPEQTVVMQGDPRSPQSPRINQSTGPNQSRSFKVLQKITDTIHDNDGDDDSGSSNTQERNVEREDPMEYQQPHFSRPMQQSNLVENQMKRMQISDNEKAYMDRMKNQSAMNNQNQRFAQQRSGLDQDENPQQYIPPSEQQVREPNLYLGSAIPSRSFKILQAMTNTEDNDS